MKNKSKLQTIQDAIRAEDFKRAFGIARKFFFGLTADEKRCIEIAADVTSGQRSFYIALGVDVDEQIEAAKRILLLKYVI